MVEFFALSVISAIHASGNDYKLTPDIDAQNAIVYEHLDNSHYFKIWASLEDRQYHLSQIVINKDCELLFELTEKHDTINSVIKSITLTIERLKNG